MTHRPALDGLRGVAVTAVMAYHVVPEPLTGGWLGVDIFFVLSGYLIAAMLLRERDRWGHVDVLGFLRRRARRLLPGQATVLLATLIASAIWLYPGRRAAVAGDITAAAVQVVNWRFIASGESYFAQIAMPSPVRHLWSLSAQEQFYLVFPLLLAGLALLRRLWARVAVVAALAALSAARMWQLYEPDTDPSRVYYGTDTRAFEVLIGVAVALALWRRSFVDSPAPRRHDRVLGIVGVGGLAVVLAAMFVVNEYSALVFRGGLLAVCLVTVVVIVAASSPQANPVQRVLGVRPLRWLGRYSYSLYLWHWPVIVFVTLALPGWAGAARQALSVALTFALAWASDTVIERPIRTRGAAALLPPLPRVGRAVAVLAVPVVLAGAQWLARPVLAQPTDGGVTLAAAPSEPLPTPVPIAYLGNSTAHALAEPAAASSPKDLPVVDISSLGCSPFERPIVQPTGRVPDSAECAAWRRDWTDHVARHPGAIVVFVAMSRLLSDVEIDGDLLVPGVKAHDAVVRSILDETRERALAAGASRFVVLDLPCRQRPDLGTLTDVTRNNDPRHVQHLNAVITEWGRATDSPVLDLDAVLCPEGRYEGSINGAPAYADGVHFTPEAGRAVHAWLVPQLRAIAAAR